MVMHAAAFVLLAALPSAAGSPEEGWTAALYDRVAEDLKAGRPLVVQAHVALCDRSIIRCGGHGLGDGDSLTTNLFWATSGGMRGWFERRGSGWTRVGIVPGAALGRPPEVLAVAVWRRRVAPAGALRARGVREPFDVFVVAEAWRGKAIDQTAAAYLHDLGGSADRPLTVAGTTLAAGGAAAIVAYVGHNRWMDYERVEMPWAPDAPAGQPKGTAIVACKSAQYLGRAVPSPGRVPLLFTSDFVFAGAYGLDAAVQAFAEGAGLREVRARAIAAYATGEGKPEGRVRSIFTNPSDPRWVRWR
jgi:hypothetical protein